MKTGGKRELFTACSWTEVGFEQRLAPGWARALLMDITQPSSHWISMGKATVSSGWRGHRLHAQWALRHLKISLTGPCPQTALILGCMSRIRSSHLLIHPHNFSHFLIFSLHLQYRFGGRCFPFGDSWEGITFTYDISPRYLRVFRPKAGRHFWLLFLTLWHSSNEAMSSKQLAALIGGGRGVKREGREGNILSVRKHHLFNTSI